MRSTNASASGDDAKSGKSMNRTLGANMASTPLSTPPTMRRNDVVSEMRRRASFFPPDAIRGMSTYADTRDATSANTR
ncbi:MAG: hypothetical protein K2V38_16145, partial [Gemmataceae bacterium]|nr:hypothetical protein [Gemmataceae bacterium]